MIKESTGNMYPGFKTWNPLAGKCEHECEYCSSNSFMRYPVFREKYSGCPRLDRNTLEKRLGIGKMYFVVAQNDLFQAHISKCWISEVLRHCCMYDNTYLFQTKNPERFVDFLQEYPEKTIFCTTIETNREYSQMGNTPSVSNRAFGMWNIRDANKQVTIEPIMDFDLTEMVELIKMCEPKSVNIGADSKHNHLTEPSKDKLLALIDELKKFTIIDQKRNLDRLLK